MSFIIIEISSITYTGFNGAILQIISHGFIGDALFFLVGTSYKQSMHLDFLKIKNHMNNVETPRKED